jgi:hypothetical protein
LLWKSNSLTSVGGRRFDEAEARTQIKAELSQYFEKAFREMVEMFRAKLNERLAVHTGRAGALINLIRQTAANLMEITISLPRSNEAFEVKREPYWVAPETVGSLLGMSASAVNRFLPSGMRENRARNQLAADTKKAVLRNIANLDWAIRQNIEEGFRRFESSLTEELGSALLATRQAMLIASERRCARVEEIDAYVKESTRSIRDLTFDRGQKWFFAVLESDPGGCSRAGLDERRNGGDRRNTGRQQGRPQKRVEQRALPAFELTQHCDAKQALVEPRPQ